MTNQTITSFSTGAHLQAVECIINGAKQWRRVAVGFEDESFLDEETVNPVEYADRQHKLIGAVV